MKPAAVRRVPATLIAAVAAFAVAGVVPADSALVDDTLTIQYREPAWAPTGGLIAFVQSTPMPIGGGAIGFQTSVNVMRTDGSGVRRVAGQPAVEELRVAWPTWSPDGRRLAFGDGSLYVVNLDGTGLRRLFPGGGSCCAAWGPGGRKIAFSGAPDAQADIWIMNRDGTRSRRVAIPDREHSYWGPTWSPGGQKLAFFSDEVPDVGSGAAKTSLGVLSAYLGKVRHIAVAFPAEPDWSPDGRKIAFDGIATISATGVRRIGGIRVLDLRTGRVTVLHEGKHPSWSPDSRRLAFEDNHQIFVMNANGSNVTQLTS